MVTRAVDQVGDSVAMLDKIEVALKSLAMRRENLQMQIDRIEWLGFCDARPWYREEKFLYLIYPMVNGERKREYIGCDPEKITDALAKIERKAEYEKLSNELSSVEIVLGRVRSSLASVLGTCYSVKW